MKTRTIKRFLAMLLMPALLMGVVACGGGTSGTTGTTKKRMTIVQRIKPLVNKKMTVR